MYYFTSDEHYGHANVIKYCNRPFRSLEEMDYTIISKHNDRVRPGDVVIHAGDFSFIRNREEVFKRYINKLKGTHIFLNGSHDNWLKKNTRQIWTKTIKGQYIVVCHYAMRTWPRSHFNSWQLYGHCIDLETEILTNNGWKNRMSLTSDDAILTLNFKTYGLEYNKILKIIDFHNFTGKVFSVQTSSINFRVTNKHVLIDQIRGSHKCRKFYVDEISKIQTREFIKSGMFMNQEDIDISDDNIRLLVWIAADGSICNSNLCRIRIFKQRKIDRIRWLLNRIGIIHKEHPQKDGTISFDFNIPITLDTYRWKPLCNEFTNFNRHQTEIALHEYTHTDGKQYGKTILIWTSKKKEVDIIQIMCIKNGFSCHVSQIKGGYSSRSGHCLCITDRTTKRIPTTEDKIQVEDVSGEHFWCIKTENQNFMMRRGSTHMIIGNSHGKLEPIGKQWDIGVDNNNFYPISFEELKQIMDKRPDNPNLV